MKRREQYDLEERTICFAREVLAYVKKRRSWIGNDIVRQLSRSATSVAVNYMEACVAESTKDFRHKCCICAKEAKESWFWLRLIAPEHLTVEDTHLIQETPELTKIFSSIRRAYDQSRPQGAVTEHLI